MDVENLLAKAADSLSVRRAFGAAYEKDGLLIIPVAMVAAEAAAAQHVPSAVTRLPTRVARGRAPRRTRPHRRTQGAQR